MKSLSRKKPNICAVDVARCRVRRGRSGDTHRTISRKSQRPNPNKRDWPRMPGSKRAAPEGKATATRADKQREEEPRTRWVASMANRYAPPAPTPLSTTVHAPRGGPTCAQSPAINFSKEGLASHTQWRIPRLAVPSASVGKFSCIRTKAAVPVPASAARPKGGASAIAAKKGSAMRVPTSSTPTPTSSASAPQDHDSSTSVRARRSRRENQRTAPPTTFRAIRRQNTKRVFPDRSPKPRPGPTTTRASSVVPALGHEHTRSTPAG